MKRRNRKERKSGTHGLGDPASRLKCVGDVSLVLQRWKVSPKAPPATKRTAPMTAQAACAPVRRDRPEHVESIVLGDCES